MKLFTSIVLVAGAAIGTAAVINKVTDGYAKEAIVDKIFGIDDIEDDGIGEDLGPIKDFDLLTDEYGNKHVIMPADDAKKLPAPKLASETCRGKPNKLFVLIFLEEIVPDASNNGGKADVIGAPE